MTPRRPEPDSPPVLVLGVGNEFRGDDAVGILLARRAARGAGSQVRVRELSGEGTELMEAWKESSRVLVFDAVRSHSAPGTIHRMEAHRDAIPSDFFHYSSHAFGLAEAVELSRILGSLPACLVIYGIEAECFTAGEALSARVAAAAETVLARVAEENWGIAPPLPV